jgi:hypothetical protein
MELDPTFPDHLRHIRHYSVRFAIFEAQSWRCGYCGIRFSDDADCNDSATIDEIIPVSHQGPKWWLNQIGACKLCNTGRDTRNAYDYFEEVLKIGRTSAARWRQRLARARKKANRKRSDQIKWVIRTVKAKFPGAKVVEIR